MNSRGIIRSFEFCLTISEGSSWVERKLVSHGSALVYERSNFKFFSVMSQADLDVSYIGLFGVWVAVPSWRAIKQMWSSRTD